MLLQIGMRAALHLIIFRESSMNRLVFPALIVVGIACVGYAVTRPSASDEEVTVKLPVAAAQVSQLTPYLAAAAKDLGASEAKAYDGSAFVKMGEDSISFTKDKTSLQMRVAFDSKYRHARADRDQALKKLEATGESIYEHAVSLQAIAASKDQVALRVQ